MFQKDKRCVSKMTHYLSYVAHSGSFLDVVSFGYPTQKLKVQRMCSVGSSSYGDIFVNIKAYSFGQNKENFE